MGFHFVGTSGTSTASTTGNVLSVPVQVDGWLTRNSTTSYFIPVPPRRGGKWRLRAAYAQGPTMTIARVNNANLQAYWGLPSIIPVVQGAVVPSLYPLRDFGSRAPEIPVADQFGFQADNNAAAELQRFAAILHDGDNSVPPGPISALQFTASIAATAETWSSGVITLAQALQPGTYAIVGLDVVGATQMFARLVMAEGGPRPGVISRASNAIFPPFNFSGGSFGEFGRFTNYSVPQLEILNTATATIAIQGVLEVIRVGPPGTPAI